METQQIYDGNPLNVNFNGNSSNVNRHSNPENVNDDLGLAVEVVSKLSKKRPKWTLLFV
jgi:hypothetical protein